MLILCSICKPWSPSSSPAARSALSVFSLAAGSSARLQTSSQTAHSVSDIGRPKPDHRRLRIRTRDPQQRSKRGNTRTRALHQQRKATYSQQFHMKIANHTYTLNLPATNFLQCNSREKGQESKELFPTQKKRA